MKSLPTMYLPNRWQKTVVSAVVLVFSLTLAQDNNPQTIYSLAIFSNQKPCATGCFVYYGHCQSDSVAYAIQCSTSYCVPNLGALDSCYCRTDLQPIAESYLSSCILSSCTIGNSSIDASSAVSIYSSYCSSKGYPINVVASTTTSSSVTSSTGGKLSIQKTRIINLSTNITLPK